MGCQKLDEFEIRINWSPNTTLWSITFMTMRNFCRFLIQQSSLPISLITVSTNSTFHIYCAQSLSRVWLCATLWTVAHQAPLSVGFFRQEYWRGLLFLPPGNLPDPGIEPTTLTSPALAGGFFTTEPPGKPYHFLSQIADSVFKFNYPRNSSPNNFIVFEKKDK